MKKYTWRTHKTIKETQDSITLQFETDQQQFSYLPGQYLNIRYTINGEIVIRSYSFSSKPSDPNPAITVKRVTGGKMSNYIFENADQIETWEIEAQTIHEQTKIEFNR